MTSGVAGPLAPDHRPRALRASPVAAGWVTLVRWLLALAFVPAGLGKLFGYPILPYLPRASMAVFDAMHAVGPYWRFLGLGQAAGGLLLLPARTAAAGAVACLPVVANIAVLLYALPFQASDRVTGVLLLAGNVLVLAWEWPRVAPLLAPGPHPGTARTAARAALADMWRRRWARLALLALAVLWLAVHVADRMNDP